MVGVKSLPKVLGLPLDEILSSFTLMLEEEESLLTILDCDFSSSNCWHLSFTPLMKLLGLMSLSLVKVFASSSSILLKRVLFLLEKPALKHEPLPLLELNPLSLDSWPLD